MENLSSPIFFWLQGHCTIWWDKAVSLSACSGPFCVTSCSPHLPDKETEAKRVWSLPGDHSSKGGAAEISKSPSVLGCNTRASSAADACLVFFCAKSSARDRKQNEIQHRLFLSSSLQHLLSHTLLALVLFLFLEKIDTSRDNLRAPGSLQIVLSHAHESCFLSVTRNHLSCCHLLFFSYRWLLPTLLNLKGRGGNNYFLATQYFST